MSWEEYEREHYQLVDLAKDEADEFRTLLKSHIGPTPWSLAKLPSVEGTEWQVGEGFVKLCATDGECLLVLGFYVWPFMADKGVIGLWSTGRKHQISFYRFGDLRPFKVPEVTPDGVGRVTGVMAGVQPFEFLEIEDGLAKGQYSVKRISVAPLVSEFLQVAHSGVDNLARPNEPALSIYSWKPAAGRLDVFPQAWFTGAKFDIGYEWVSHVVRNPHTGRIVGAGFRIPQFELDETDCSVARWFRVL